jgi:pSer/pThr/pTyr-binding forkhead associated (FHA) protein
MVDRAWLEVTRAHSREVVPLGDGRVTIGRGEANDVPLQGDRQASRLHAVIERIGSHWCLRDMASANGTYVNGERIVAERPLQHGDDVRIGAARIVVHARTAELTETEAAEALPALTPRERDVLIALCRPILGTDSFTEPASIREIAAELVVTEAAVKQHLWNLYDKFAVPTDVRRRVRLANEAVRRGAVTLGDLRP